MKKSELKQLIREVISENRETILAKKMETKVIKRVDVVPAGNFVKIVFTDYESVTIHGDNISLRAP